MNLCVCVSNISFYKLLLIHWIIIFVCFWSHLIIQPSCSLIIISHHDAKLVRDLCLPLQCQSSSPDTPLIRQEETMAAEFDLIVPPFKSLLCRLFNKKKNQRHVLCNWSVQCLHRFRWKRLNGKCAPCSIVPRNPKLYGQIFALK